MSFSGTTTYSDGFFENRENSLFGNSPMMFGGVLTNKKQFVLIGIFRIFRVL